MRNIFVSYLRKDHDDEIVDSAVVEMLDKRIVSGREIGELKRIIAKNHGIKPASVILLDWKWMDKPSLWMRLKEFLKEWK